jgi:tetratricopeptide (TPR) repeat protein
MPPPIRKYDALGFPVPATFEDLPLPDTGKSKSALPVAPAPVKQGASLRKRVFLGGVLLVAVLMAAIPWLTSTGKELLGDWLAQRAHKRFNAGDMPGTVADSTRAFSLLGEELEEEKQAELLCLRGLAKQELNDLQGSREDFDRVLNSPKTNRALRVRCYLGRSWVNCRLKNFGDAVSDATVVIELAGEQSPALPLLLNQRAYIRALGNISKEELEAGLKDIERAMEMTRDNPAYIDTRGYLLHLLGRHDEALRDMNRAIKLTASVQGRVYRAEDAKKLREDLAVMFYHRGLIHEALGLKDQAEEDLQRADEFGYDPEAGVW